MWIDVLGPLQVRDDEQILEIRGTRVRRLLVRLAVDAPRAVSTAELVDAVWTGEDPPANVTNAVQSLVSRLRRVLDWHNAVQQAPNGYSLHVDREAVDAHRFQDLAVKGRHAIDTDPGRARDMLAAALALWRGEPLLDAGGAEYALALTGRWEQQHIDVHADHMAARLAAGEGSALVGDLSDLVAAYPLDERFTGQLMKALARAGRPAEALRIYEDLRGRLAEELGADPSQELQTLHVDLLRGDEQAAAPAPTRTNLPNAVTNFVGRDEEMKRLGLLLESSRLVTIAGPGGAGKTRLASEVARSRLEDEPDGVWLIELAPVTDPTNVVQAFLTALDIRESHLLDTTRESVGTRDPRSRLGDALSAARCLLVVDNCEHLIEPVAGLVDSLLAECQNLQVLATSREPLGIDGEALCTLASLDLPPAGVDPASVLDYAAVRLFADRAEAVRADFALDADTTPFVIDIVHRLDGLPLAIELAAARLRVLPVAEISARLDDRFRLLTGGSRTAMPRHRTLRAVVEWSWDLLSPNERLLTERLAVFPAGATVDAASAVCGDEQLPPRAIAGLLDALVEKSLLQSTGAHPVRYRMLETLREYGVERLTERGEVADVRLRHARYFAGLVRFHEPRLRGREQLDSFAELEAERDNALAALRFLGDSGDAQGALDLALGMSIFWMLRSDNAEATYWIEYSLGVPGPVEENLRVFAQALRLMTGYHESVTLHSESGRAELTQLKDTLSTLEMPGSRAVWLMMLRLGLALFTEDDAELTAVVEEGMASPDEWTRAAVQMMQAAVAENHGDTDEVRASAQQALARFEALGDRWGIAISLATVGQVCSLDGDLDGAMAAFDRAEAAMAELGARTDESMLAMRKAGLYLRLGDVAAARSEMHVIQAAGERSGSPMEQLLGSVLEAGVALFEGDPSKIRRSREVLQQQVADLAPAVPIFGHGRAMAMTMLASLDTATGDLDSAAELLQEGYDAAVGTRDLPIVASAGVSHAVLAHARGESRRAAEMLGAAAVLRGAEDPTDVQVAAITEKLRASLGAEFDTAYATGRALDKDSAITHLNPTPTAEKPDLPHDTP